MSRAVSVIFYLDEMPNTESVENSLFFKNLKYQFLSSFLKLGLHWRYKIVTVRDIAEVNDK